MSIHFNPRAQLQVISHFIATGDELLVFDDTAPEERFDKYYDAMYERLETYRKEILAADWEGMTEDEQTIENEKLLRDFSGEHTRIIRFIFQVGLCEGIVLGQEIYATAAVASSLK